MAAPSPGRLPRVKEQLIPLYVGLPANCTSVTTKPNLITNGQADAQGRAAAADALHDRRWCAVHLPRQRRIRGQHRPPGDRQRLGRDERGRPDPGLSGLRLGANKTELAGAGDFNRDGVPDLAARLNDDGGLYLWTGRKGGFTDTRLKLGADVSLRIL